MNDAVLQVLLILAYLAIGLISVTFPIYAISVNFLPQQKWENEKEQRKRMDELKSKISQLTAEMKGDKKQVSQLKEQLDKYEAELEGTELRYQYLTAKGAVLAPVAALVPALLFAVVGIYAFYKDSREWAIGLGGFSALSSVVALYRLYKTISAVEYGALKPERTVEFQVGFEKDYRKTIETKFNDKAKFRIFARTHECEVETLVLLATFPAVLGAKCHFKDPDLSFSQFDDVAVAKLSEDYVPKGMGVGFYFSVTPQKIGKYSINVRVCAKGIYDTREELTIEVV